MKQLLFILICLLSINSFGQEQAYHVGIENGVNLTTLRGTLQV